MKTWKKCNQSRYELYLDDPETSCDMAVLYVNENAMDFSCTYLGNLHSPLNLSTVKAAQIEIEKRIYDEATKAAEIHQKIADALKRTIAQ